jgi:uncharacterized membrane protein (UPF0127 family)
VNLSGLRAGLIVALALLAGACQPAAEVAPADTPAATAAPLTPVTIRSGEVVRMFQVEVARTPAEQARGLMYRPALAPDAGMLFLFDPPERAAFWMKNTYIPLDMLFIRGDGTIARIAANTTPLSLAPVDAGETVVAVLEIAGGRAAGSGIRAGDRVSWPGGPD